MVFMDHGVSGKEFALFRLFHVGLQVQEALDPGGLKEFILELQHLHEVLFGVARGFDGVQKILNDLFQDMHGGGDQKGPQGRAPDNDEFGPLQQEQGVSPGQEKTSNNRNYHDC